MVKFYPEVSQLKSKKDPTAHCPLGKDIKDTFTVVKAMLRFYMVVLTFKYFFPYTLHTKFGT